MPFKFKRQQTPFGQIFYKRGLPGGTLLITEHGKALGFDYGKRLGSLLKNVRIDRQDNVFFGPKVHPVPIGSGYHAKVFRIFPKEEQQFFSANPKQGRAHHVPSVVLKVYRESVEKKDKPDGFTQFLANSFVFNYLKKIPSSSYIPRPLQTYFVSEKLAVRKFINAPTLEEAWIALSSDRMVSEPLGQALSNDQIYRFLKKNRIKFQDLDRMDRELLHNIEAGAKGGYKAGLPIEPDATMRNVFVVGKAPDGRLLVSVIDQGKHSIAGASSIIMRWPELFR